MTKFLQIVLLTVAVLWFKANGKPLFQGISFQRGFEINFKPLPRSPITFIKEKWSPFGVFGRKHSLQKRNSASVAPVDEPAPIVPLFSEVPALRPAAPVFEHVEETEHLRTAPFIPLPQTSKSIIPIPISSPAPPPISALQPEFISPVPLIVSSPAPPTVLVTPVPHPTFRYVPPQSISPAADVLLQPSSVRMDGSLPPISTNMIISPSTSGRFTDISGAVPVRDIYLNTAQPIPPPIEVEEKAVTPLETTSVKPEPTRNDVAISDNALVRGSKLALYFGSIFLQLMSQFMNNARATFDQMTNPPPVFNN